MNKNYKKNHNPSSLTWQTALCIQPVRSGEPQEFFLFYVRTVDGCTKKRKCMDYRILQSDQSSFASNHDKHSTQLII